MRKFTVRPNTKVCAASKSKTISGDVAYDRLINKCYWSPDEAWELLDENEQYTLRELSDILGEACYSSGNFDSMHDALDWGKQCAKAIFEDREPY